MAVSLGPHDRSLGRLDERVAAAHWMPEDLPNLELIILMFDRVARRTASVSLTGELRLWCDNYGISPKGQQDQRWQRPKVEEAASPKPASGPSRYEHLRVVGADPVLPT